MSNRPSQLPKNYTGISITPDNGKIDITMNVMEKLGYPRYVEFGKFNNKFMSIIPAKLNDEDSFKINVGNKGGHYVCSVDLVRDIFKTFNIKRIVTDRCSPFYHVTEAKINGVYGVLVQMNNFKDKSL